MNGLIGLKIRVLTSQYYSNEIGTIKFICKKTVTVDFNGAVGIYTIEKNKFEFVKENSLLPDNNQI